MKNLFVITAEDIITGNSAPAARILKIARSVALAGTRVFLCSLCHDTDFDLENTAEISSNVFAIGKKTEKPVYGKIAIRMRTLARAVRLMINVSRIMAQTSGNSSIYLYPSGIASIDFLCLIYLKGIHHHKIYYETNEVRIFVLHNRLISKKYPQKIMDLARYLEDYCEFKLMEKMTRFYDGLIVISTKIEKYFSRYNGNLLRVPILSDTGEKQFAAAPPCYPGNDAIFSLCFTGLLTLKKEGFDLLYQAMAAVKKTGRKIDLHLYGPIHAREKEAMLSALPEHLGLEGCIHYHGQVDNAILIREMQKYHLLILPRPWSLQADHGFSTKLSEYMVSGVPVLVTNVSDNALFIKDGVNGYIVQPGDPVAMSQKLLEIMDHYHRTAATIAENAFATARDNFHYAIYSKKLAEFMS